MRLAWSSLCALLAILALVVGTSIFAVGLAIASTGNGDHFGDMVLLGVILLGVPVAMLTLLLGGLALIYSRPAQEHSKRVRRITLCLVGAVFAPMGLWMFLAADGLSPIAPILAVTGVGALYVLVGDIIRNVKATASGR